MLAIRGGFVFLSLLLSIECIAQQQIDSRSLISEPVEETKRRRRDVVEDPLTEAPVPRKQELLESGARLIGFGEKKGVVEGQYIVRFKRSLDAAGILRKRSFLINKPLANLLPTDSVAAESIAIAIVKKHKGKLGQLYRENLDLYPAEQSGFVIENISEKKARELADDPRVDSVQPVHQFELAAVQNAFAFWHLDQLDQRTLNNRDSRYVYDYTGSGTRIWVLDTGINVNHTEFTGRHPVTTLVDGSGVGLVADCTRATSLASNLCFGVDPNGAYPNYRNLDCDGHGTAVASVAMGTQTGVAKLAQVFGVIVTKSCNGEGGGSGGTSVDIVKGLDWVINKGRANKDIINLSLMGPPGGDTAVDVKIAQALNLGYVVVVAAGQYVSAINSSSNVDACTVSLGATLPNVITVGAVTGLGENIGNYGSCIEVFAPGLNVRGAVRTNNTSILAQTGTSLAAPQVAGIAALYLEQYPLSTPYQVQVAIVNGATNGVLALPPCTSGCSPNKHAYSLLTDGPNTSGNGGGPTPPYSGPDPPITFTQKYLVPILDFLLGTAD